MKHDVFKYPQPEAAAQIAFKLGVPPDAILNQGQDGEYTFPEAKDLEKYMTLYTSEQMTDLEKRVLGCFIIQALNDLIGEGIEEQYVFETLQLLVHDKEIHHHEFQYWSLLDDDTEEEDWFYITRFIRQLCQ